MQRLITQLAAFGFGALALSGCGPETEKGADAGPSEMSDAASIPAGWKTVTGNCGLTLSAPSPLATPGNSASGCAAGFATEGCFFDVTLGVGIEQFDPGPIGEGVGYTSEAITVDGRAAQLYRSQGRASSNHLIVGLYVRTVWNDAPDVSLMVVGTCTDASRAEAPVIFSTLRLPADEAAAAMPLESSADCTGEEERPIEGYLLGNPCPGPRVRVPGVCAVGARRNGATGNGSQLCFVAGDAFYAAHVSYGEYVIGSGARHGRGELFSSQITSEETTRCAALIAQLPKPDGAQIRITNEYIAPPCE